MFPLNPCPNLYQRNPHRGKLKQNLVMSPSQFLSLRKVQKIHQLQHKLAKLTVQPKNKPGCPKVPQRSHRPKQENPNREYVTRLPLELQIWKLNRITRIKRHIQTPLTLSTIQHKNWGLILNWTFFLIGFLVTATATIFQILKDFYSTCHRSQTSLAF